MKRKIMLVISLSLICTMLGACGNKNQVDIDETAIEETTIGINKDGTVELAAVENFDKDYYDESELKSYTESTISEFNTKCGTEDAAKLDQVSVKSGKAYASIMFNSIENFEDYYNTGECKLYNWEDLKKKKFVPDEFKAVLDSSSISTSAINMTANYKVLVVEGDYHVKVVGKIVYYTAGAIIGNDEIKVTSDAKTIIIYEE